MIFSIYGGCFNIEENSKSKLKKSTEVAFWVLATYYRRVFDQYTPI